MEDTLARGEAVRKMFAAIAPCYDLLNRLLSFGRDRFWRRIACAQVHLPPGSLVLDVCCGTADIALEVVRQFQDAKVVGVDFCQEMLVLGRGKVGRAGFEGRVHLQAAEASALPFQDGSFEAAFVAFGIRNVVDYEKGLAELRRVVKPGGKVILLEFAMPEGRLFGPVYRLYFQRLLPWIGHLISGHPFAYSYLPASVLEFPNAKALDELLLRVGFREVRSFPLTGGVVAVHIGIK